MGSFIEQMDNLDVCIYDGDFYDGIWEIIFNLKSVEINSHNVGNEPSYCYLEGITEGLGKTIEYLIKCAPIKYTSNDFQEKYKKEITKI